ncbi:MAG: histidinol-phosphatase [Bacteroidota bacterium]
MPWTNYHSHSHYCDGKSAPREHLEMAVEKGFYAFGCSSHAPVSFPNSWCMPREKLGAYVAEIRSLGEAFADRLKVFVGLEVDYIPGEITPHSDWIQAAGLDYTVGSVHFVDQFPDGTHWGIDGTYQEFLRGLEEIWQGDIEAAASRYYELTLEMVREARPTMVGHLDKFKMHALKSGKLSETETWYRKLMEETLTQLAETGIIVEVNTRGRYKKKLENPYPSFWVLERMYELGIPICLNSDSHATREIAAAFEETAQKLREIGYEELMILDEKGWRAVSFDQNGIHPA